MTLAMTDQDTRLHLSPPHLSGEEIEFVKEAFASNYIAPLGPMVDAFEDEFSSYTGFPYCLAVSSGTAAMHLALRHILEENGWRVEGTGQTGCDAEKPLILASTFTFIGSVSPAVYLGADITFIDCDPHTWNMDSTLLEEEIVRLVATGRPPAAVIPTDIYGQCADLPRINEICRRHSIPLIADSAESVGATYRLQEEEDIHARESVKDGFSEGKESTPVVPGKNQQTVTTNTKEEKPGTTSKMFHAGWHADAAVFSFNGNKLITTSGGGILGSHDKGLIEHARKLATQAREPVNYYQHTEIGYNYRMSNIVAAIGRGQLRVVDKRVEQARAIFQAYRERLGGHTGINFMPEAAYNRSSRWLTPILVDPGKTGTDNTTLLNALTDANIEARPIWKPMHLQPVFQNNRVVGGQISENIFDHGLCLPTGTAMSEDDIDRVCKIIETYI
ncbi:MAG: DegT/DnrJ/EryC1/StrS family aminotransferase [Lentisphaeria bacterium]